MSQDIIIDNIIMTILFSLVLKKKNLFVNTNTIHSVESFLLWNSYTTFFFTIFLHHLQLLRERNTETWSPHAIWNSLEAFRKLIQIVWRWTWVHHRMIPQSIFLYQSFWKRSKLWYNCCLTYALNLQLYLSWTFSLQHEGRVPQNYKEKDMFKQTIRGG